MSRQSAVKQARLLEKAEELFLKHGYKAVSMDEIAHEAGISKMTIYKHYHSKDDLFLKVLLDLTDRHTAVIEAKVAEIDHTLGKIEYIYSYSMETATLFSDSFIRELMERTVVMQHLAEYKLKWTYGLWCKILEEGIMKAEIRMLDVPFTARLLLGLPNAFITSDDFLNHQTREKLLYNFYDFVKYGLLGTRQA